MLHLCAVGKHPLNQFVTLCFVYSYVNCQRNAKTSAVRVPSWEVHIKSYHFYVVFSLRRQNIGDVGMTATHLGLDP